MFSKTVHLLSAGLRLLGIGRNQYIDLMNQCRSSKVNCFRGLFLLTFKRSNMASIDGGLLVRMSLEYECSH